jgi:NAD-dependent DNA ligase
MGLKSSSFQHSNFPTFQLSNLKKFQHSNIPTLNYYIQPKYDGLGLAVIYEYGRMVQAVTRGSGVE